MFDAEFWAVIERFRAISNGKLSEIQKLMALLLLHWPRWKQECFADWFNTCQHQVEEVAELREIIQCEGSPSKLESFITALIFHGRFVFESVLSQPTRLTEIGFRKPYSKQTQQLQETWFSLNMEWIIRDVLLIQDREGKRQKIANLEQRFPGILQDVTFQEVLGTSAFNLGTTKEQDKERFFKNYIHWNEFEQWLIKAQCHDLFSDHIA